MVTRCDVVRRALAVGFGIDGHRRQQGASTQGNDGSAVEVDGHTAVAAIGSCRTVDANITKVFRNDIGGRDVVKDEPRGEAVKADA